VTTTLGIKDVTRRTSNALICAFLAISNQAFAGITIHFQGRAADAQAVERVVENSCERARANGWSCERVAGDDIRRVDGITARKLVELEKTNDLAGSTGVVIRPHEMSEPLYLVFSRSGQMNNFVKTQFAGPDIHVKVVELLEAIRPLLVSLEFEDEGGYALTKDRAKLVKEFDGVDAAMAKIKREHPEATGPIKRPDGRILDLVSKK